jgi:outer membrane protein assembly factor BamB
LDGVSRLKAVREAWAFKLAGPAAAGVSGVGALTAPPVVQNGVVYLQDEDANVYALALATGKLKWEYQVNLPEKSGPGPDGVAVAGGTVYGDSSTSVFALSAATGKTVWVDGNLLNSGQGAFEIQPQVADGRVYLASAYGSGPGGGVLMALNASTGHLLWKFNTVIGQGTGVQALGLGSGGAWEPPLVGSDGDVRHREPFLIEIAGDGPGYPAAPNGRGPPGRAGVPGRLSRSSATAVAAVGPGGSRYPCPRA